jgi:hypothetical protein
MSVMSELDLSLRNSSPAFQCRYWAAVRLLDRLSPCPLVLLPDPAGTERMLLTGGMATAVVPVADGPLRTALDEAVAQFLCHPDTVSPRHLTTLED